MARRGLQASRSPAELALRQSRSKARKDPRKPGSLGSDDGVSRLESVDSPECEALAEPVESPPPGGPGQMLILGTC